MKMVRLVDNVGLIAVVCVLHFEAYYVLSGRITSVSPLRGSVHGATRLTIKGQDFARNQFNFGQGNENLGNEVILVSAKNSYQCDIEKYGTTHTQIICLTRPMKADAYKFKLKVDGVDQGTSSCCTFRAKTSYTPSVQSILPQLTVPKSMLTISGKIITGRLTVNVKTDDKGRTELLQRVYVGGQKCELLNPDANDTSYGIQITGYEYGTLKCKMEGSFVGSQNVSFIVSGSYGRSAKPKMQLHPGNKLGMLLTYAEIEEMDVKQGGTEGGTLITINGNNFDKTTNAVMIYVNGVECLESIYVNSTQIKCKTPAKPPFPLHSLNPGGFGLLVESWDGGTAAANNLDVRELNSSHDGYRKTYLSESYLPKFDNARDVKISGYFVPPLTSFYYVPSWCSPFFLRETMDATLKVISAATGKIKLNKGNSYYIEEIMTNTRGNLKYCLHANDSLYTYEQTVHAKSEAQEISLTTKQRHEIQKIEFINWNNLTGHTSVNEIQQIVLSGQGQDYSLGFNGAWTGLISVTDSAQEIEAHLNALPTIKPDQVEVTEITPQQEYTVEFKSGRGDMRLLSSFSRQSSLAVNVTEERKGVASLDTFELAVEDITTGPIAKNADENTVKAAVTGLFYPSCGETLLSPPSAIYTNDFEEAFSGNLRHYRYSGDSFCGAYSLKNSYDIHVDEFKVEPSGTYLCFAYKSSSHISRLHFRASYKDDIFAKTRKILYLYPTVDGFISDSRWHYRCIEVYNLLTTAYGNTMMETIVEYVSSSPRLDYIDTVAIMKNLPPSLSQTDEFVPNRREALPQRISDVDVTRSDDGYLIDITPKECSHNFELLAPYNSWPENEQDSEQDERGDLYSQTTWPTGVAVNVTRISDATPGISGEFDIIFQRKKKLEWTIGAPEIVEDTKLFNIPVDISPTDLENVFQDNDVADVGVYRYGACAGYSYRITFLSLTGNQLPMQVDMSNARGPSVNGSVTTVSDGAMVLDPIPGWMLRTHEQESQVMAFINDVPANCTGDCSFYWNEAITPSIQSVTPSSGTKGDVLSITGDGFANDASRMSVKVGSSECAVSSAQETSISCQLGSGEAGTYPVKVSVAGVGYASGDKQFNYEHSITSFTPTSVYTTEWSLVKIVGTGFTKNALVTFGNGSEICHIKSIENELITCEKPVTTVIGRVHIHVDINQVRKTSTDKILFEEPRAFIDEMIITDTSIGKRFNLKVSPHTDLYTGPADKRLKVGEHFAKIETYNGTDVTGILPTNPPGSYRLMFKIGDQEYAEPRVPNVIYTNRVYSVEPNIGSLFGGTKFTITGEGFSNNAAENEVKMGEVPCIVDTSTSTSLTCQLAHPSKTHHVDNMGEHPVHGTGFMWSPQTLQVKVTDTVRWRWISPENINAQYKVQQVESSSSSASVTDGFASPGSSTSAGIFEHTFTKAGTFYYTSGPVDRNGDVVMRGVVLVVEHDESKREKIAVKIHGFEAEYQPQQQSNTTQAPGCQRMTSGKADCPAVDPMPASNEFMYDFHECFTPRLTNITYEQNDAGFYDVAITGNGFSDDACATTVKMNGDLCSVTDMSETSIDCEWKPSSDLTIGASYRLENLVSLHVFGYGYGFVESASDKVFTPMPVITSITPNQGSLAGGTKIVISGMHLHSKTFSPQVTVRGIMCSSIVDVSATSITCVTRAASAGPAVVSLQGFPGACLQSDICSFEYSANATSTVSQVTHTTNGTTAEVEITGDNFGDDENAIAVYIGNSTCEVLSLTETKISCRSNEYVVGTHEITVEKKPDGFADGNVPVAFAADKPTVSPQEGSINGGLDITLSGYGFHPSSKPSVKIGTKDCSVLGYTNTRVDCTVPGQAVAGVLDLVVKSNGYSFPKAEFSYTNATTPEVSSVNPNAGSIDTKLTIAGSGFGNDVNGVIVNVGAVKCNVESVTDTQTICSAGASPAGQYRVYVHVAGKGNATSNEDFNYIITVTSISSSEGSFAGGQTLKLIGSGYTEGDTSVQICEKKCEIVKLTHTQLACKVPANTGTDDNLVCDLKVAAGTSELTSAAAFTYKVALTPTITDVTPKRGGTAGGTNLTIQGSGFSSTSGSTRVEIGGAECVVTSVNSTTIQCTTSARKPSTRATVIVDVDSKGHAKHTVQPVEFYYIDVWSSVYTWGNKSRLPEKGDMVVVGKGETLLLDVSTPVIKIIIIKGGKLMFDNKDLELNVEIILITDNGVLEVGTESEPFQHKATIQLHGHAREPELPIYGTKTIAVRSGTLELHGKPIPITWTKLQVTANTGDTIIQLQDAVTWEAEDEIVIATSSMRHSQHENEVRRIASVTGHTVHLTKALDYDHLGINITHAGRKIELAAEVGLLTRNIVVKGSNDPQWNDAIKACPDKFDTGQFAVQTCFQGRYGEEMGSDMYGAHIMFHAPVGQKAVGHIEYVEVKHAGQAFRLGRYPIHFHLIGDGHASYVRGSSIHNTFNRAIVIHGTDNTNVENNVIYNVMGSAIFLEDGIETNNSLQHNLVVFTKSSSSLLNDDITPAAFWVANPANTIRHNGVAGGTHFGFWYRLRSHPTGPSFTTNLCPNKMPLSSFYDNSVHSVGWYGLWIFEAYTPRKDPVCSSSQTEPAVFRMLKTWHCEKGSEFVDGGAIQFHDFTSVRDEKAGVEMKLTRGVNLFSDEGALLNNSLIVGSDSGVPGEDIATKRGVVLPVSPGLLVKDTVFVNFDRSSHAALGFSSIIGKTRASTGGFSHQFSRVTFINSPNKGAFRWEHEGFLIDADGSLTGKPPGSTVVTTTGVLDPTNCEADPSFSVGVAASVCQPSSQFIRFSFNNALPSTLRGNDVIFTNEYGKTSSPYMSKRLTHEEGWMVTLPVNKTYYIEFKHATQFVNISYSGTFYGLKPTDWVKIRHRLKQIPDYLSVTSSGQMSNISLTYDQNNNGDWFIEKFKGYATYLISGKSYSRKRRSLSVMSNPNYINRWVNVKILRYDYIGPGPRDERDPNHIFYSGGGGGLVGNCTPLASVIDVEGASITVPHGCWLVVNATLPSFDRCEIQGTLEFAFEQVDGEVVDFVLNCTWIFINGGRLIVGWKSRPFENTMTFVLRGTHDTPDLKGPYFGSKFIGVYNGALELHGKRRAVIWTVLNQTAEAGSDVISLAESVDWEVGEEIVISTTSLDPRETEKATIADVQGNEVTLTEPLSYTHRVNSDEIHQGKTFSASCEVGLLSRNIKIIGEEYDDIEKESFGARVVITKSDHPNAEARARIWYTEFYRSGQYGWTERHDPRYSVAFLNIGTATADSPSSVISCAFHHGYSTAIGVFGSNNITIFDNVVHRPVGTGIQIEGIQNTIEQNLVMNSAWPGSHGGRDQSQIFTYPAGIDVINAQFVTLKNNIVVGCDRVGYRIGGEHCDASKTGAPAWAGNEAHSNMHGIAIFPEDTKIPGCVRISGFKVYKSSKFGIYVQSTTRIIVENVVLADNAVALQTVVIGPSIFSQQPSGKFVKIRDTIIIGTSNDFDCDELPPRDTNYQQSTSSDIPRTPSGGNVGVGWPIFLSAQNRAPEKNWVGDKSYPTYDGTIHIQDTTFYKFGTECDDGRMDRVLMTAPAIEDMLFPIETRRLTMKEVMPGHEIFMHNPSLSKVNPSDCVDMMCDGKKRALVTDHDGSFIGSRHPGTVLPVTEFQWDDNPRYGTGNYRIPLAAYMSPEGKRLDINDLFPKKGVYRESCEMNHVWNAYNCTDNSYKIVTMSSMDSDTELRRISPVSISGDQYIDLVNGPQDHGWCNGYTCHKRISVFPMIVMDGRHYNVHMTGTHPQHLRLRLLNAEDDCVVRIAVYYNTPYRIDVYANDILVQPMNYYIRPSDGRLILKAPTSIGQYLPKDSDRAVSNYHDRYEQYLYVLLKGSRVRADIRVSKIVILGLGFPGLTIDEFFGKNVVSNLAQFLNIPPDKIMVVDPRRETGKRRRRAIDDGILDLKLEIGDQTNDINQDPNNPIPNSTFNSIGDKVFDAYQTRQLDSILNATVKTLAVTDESRNGSIRVRYVKAPSEMVIVNDIVPGEEDRPFPSQPILRMKNDEGEFVQFVGSPALEWVIEARLFGDNDTDETGKMFGTTRAPFTDGQVRFTDLGVSLSGSYVVEFRVVVPLNLTLVVRTRPLVVKMMALKMKMSQPTEVEVNEDFSISGQVLRATDGSVPDLDRPSSETNGLVARLHMCTAECFMSSNESETIDTTVPINTTTDNTFTFETSLSKHAKYFLLVSLVYYDTNQTLQTEKLTVIKAQPSNYKKPQVTTKKFCQITFAADFQKVVGSRAMYCGVAVWNLFQPDYPLVLFTNTKCEAGSIVASFLLEGNMIDVERTLKKIYEQMTAKGIFLQLPPNTALADKTLFVDGVRYGVEKVTKERKDVILIVAIAVPVSIMILVVLIIVVVYMKCCRSRKGEFEKEKEPIPDPTLFSYLRRGSSAVQPIERILEEKEDDQPDTMYFKYLRKASMASQPVVAPNKREPELQTSWWTTDSANAKKRAEIRRQSLLANTATAWSTPGGYQSPWKWSTGHGKRAPNSGTTTPTRLSSGRLSVSSISFDGELRSDGRVNRSRQGSLLPVTPETGSVDDAPMPGTPDLPKY
ncbi:fibrocystin-L-like [Tubulanus polymorphus]|uniref:fibrocystin-L-like n=1 Tax=Tubulanus polymorphus TaxID=672921 RepID=UPI003DA57980